MEFQVGGRWAVVLLLCSEGLFSRGHTHLVTVWVVRRPSGCRARRGKVRRRLHGEMGRAATPPAAPRTGSRAAEELESIAEPLCEKCMFKFHAAREFFTERVEHAAAEQSGASAGPSIDLANLYAERGATASAM